MKSADLRLAGFIGACAAMVGAFVVFAQAPCEDAHILFRVSRNVAELGVGERVSLANGDGGQRQAVGHVADGEDRLDRGARVRIDHHVPVPAALDTGGGTFDTSVLELHENVYEVVATGGAASAGIRNTCDISNRNRCPWMSTTTTGTR